MTVTNNCEGQPMSNPFAYTETAVPAMPVGSSTVRLKRVGVISSAVFMAAAGAVGGLIAGAMLFMFSLVGAGVGGARPGGGELAMGAGLVVFLPVIYAIFGFIAGIVYSIMYNIIAGMTGGIELELGRD
jgi:hypothetical protein